MTMPLPAVIGSVIGAFLGYPALGYVAGSRLSRATPAEAMLHEGEFVVPAATVPVYGAMRNGSPMWNNVENFVGSTFPGRPVDRAPRYQSTCRQCGAPHEPRATGCEYCLTPKA